MHENLTIDYIDKTDHGVYVCQASNEHTTTNITTQIIVESEFHGLPISLKQNLACHNA